MYNQTEVVDLSTAEFPDIDEKKLLRKIDLRLVPPICILYLLAFLDRCVFTNVSSRTALTVEIQSEYIQRLPIRTKNGPWTHWESV